MPKGHPLCASLTVNPEAWDRSSPDFDTRLPVLSRYSALRPTSGTLSSVCVRAHVWVFFRQSVV